MALPSAICCAWRSRHERRRLDREAQRLGDRRQRIGLLVHEVLELVGGGGELLPDLLALQIRFDLRLHLVERARLFRRDADEADHVPAELALDRAGDLAGLHREHGVVEGLHHRAARVAAEVAALRRRARILRTLLREIARTSRDWPSPARAISSAVFFAAARLRLARIGLDGDQDVRRLPLLLLAVGLGRAVVLRLHLLRRHGDLREQRILRQHDVLEFRFLRRLERGRVGVVERLFLGRVDGDVLGERLDVDVGELDLALLLDAGSRTRPPTAFGTTPPRGDGIDDALGEDLPPDALLERGLGDPGLAQADSCRRSSENRSPSRKRGSAAMRSKTSRVRDLEMQIGALLLDEPLAQHVAAPG